MKIKKRTRVTIDHSVIRSFGHSVIRKSGKAGFTLIEMLVVIGIIAVLIGASIVGYTKMTQTADKTKAQELVDNVATALTALYQKDGNWPKRLALGGGSDGVLDENTTLPLAKAGYFSLTTVGTGKDMKLAGNDRFGLVTPWASLILKRKGKEATVSDLVSGKTDLRLHYALDLDGDGIIKGASVGGVSVDIRATAAVWCAGKDGIIAPYSTGGRADDVYSWTPGQTRNVQ